MQKQVKEDKGLFKRNVDLFEENIKIKFLLSDIKEEKNSLQQQFVSFWYFMFYEMFEMCEIQISNTLL